MQIAAPNLSTSPSSNNSQLSTNIGIDAQGFLQMLIAQARNQDPTNPMDSNQYLSQLASISLVEQSVKTNDLLNKISLESNITQADSLIGMKVTSADGLTSGVVLSVSFTEGGVTATLDTGAKIAVDSGLSISKP